MRVFWSEMPKHNCPSKSKNCCRMLYSKISPIYVRRSLTEGCLLIIFVYCSVDSDTIGPPPMSDKKRRSSHRPSTNIPATCFTMMYGSLGNSHNSPLNIWYNLKQIATDLGEVSSKHTKILLRHLWGKQVKSTIKVTFSH